MLLDLGQGFIGSGFVQVMDVPVADAVGPAREFAIQILAMFDLLHRDNEFGGLQVGFSDLSGVAYRLLKGNSARMQSDTGVVGDGPGVRAGFQREAEAGCAQSRPEVLARWLNISSANRLR